MNGWAELGRGKLDERFDTDPSNLVMITFNDVPNINPTLKYEFLGRLAVENHRQYCGRHGYGFISDIHIARDRPACWAKIPAILEAFNSYRWVLWADSDTLVLNHSEPIHNFCDPNYDLIVQSQEHFFRFIGMSIEKGFERMPINTGVFLMRASSWSRDFLYRAYDRTEYVSQGNIWDGIGEQEAMIALFRQNPEDLQHLKYVDGLQNHPRFYKPRDRFAHFYGNHAKHHISPAECEDVLRRWEVAIRNETAVPPDIARFHWCCIQNKRDDSSPVHGDLSHYLYTPDLIV